MEIKWYLEEDEYENYRKHQHEYDFDDQDGSGEGNYIGSVRTGNLCYDILEWGNHLWFDLYVGGVDTGYGYSDKEGYKNYPYDYADSCSFRWDKDVSKINIEEFKNELTQFIEKKLIYDKEYLSYLEVKKVNLIEKANEELKLW